MHTVLGLAAVAVFVVLVMGGLAVVLPSAIEAGTRLRRRLFGGKP